MKYIITCRNKTLNKFGYLPLDLYETIMKFREFYNVDYVISKLELYSNEDAIVEKINENDLFYTIGNVMNEEANAVKYTKVIVVNSHLRSIANDTKTDNLQNLVVRYF
jgi:hypothetical protein